MIRVLLVEDDTGLAFGLRNNLEIEGYEVDLATTGPQALTFVRDRAPALVILDLMLPGMDGHRVLRRIREDGINTPVLILTARGEEADTILGFRLGADDYVTKPLVRSKCWRVLAPCCAERARPYKPLRPPRTASATS
jgi:DNA-binding response OmpR family regulator